MKRLLCMGILLTSLLTTVPVSGQEVDMTTLSAPRWFKLGITVEERPLFADQREIKPMPKVDSTLIKQMLNVREDLPSWQGMHHLVPGASSGH